MSSGAVKPTKEGEGLTMDDLKAKAGEWKDKAADVAETARRQAADFQQRASDTVKHPRQTAANVMDAAASTISDRAQDLDRDSSLRSGALQTADALETGAGYIRSHRVDEMIADAGDFVVDHPGISMISAAVAGFLIGYAVFRDRD